MQADRKKLGILIIIIGLIIIIAIVYFIFLRKPVAPTTEVIPLENGTTTELPLSEQVGTTTPGDAPQDGTYNVAAEAPHKTTGDDLGQQAMSFAARFGSFSNQSNYGNFTDLDIMMTDNMKTWAKEYVSGLKSQKSSSAYYGMVTQALTYEVKKFDDNAGQAEITVGTQRRESTEKINGGESYIQNLDLSLVKVNGDWLFDKAYWQK